MAVTQNAIAGTATITVDGQNYKLAGDLKYSASTFKRETLTGQDAVHGFSEMPIAPFISMTLRDADGLKVADLNAMRNVTVAAKLANGKLVTGRNMWTVESQESDTQDGKIEVRFEGRDVVETTV